MVSASTDSNNSGIIGQPPALTSSSTRKPPARGRLYSSPADSIRSGPHGGDISGGTAPFQGRRAASQSRGCALRRVSGSHVPA